MQLRVEYKVALGLLLILFAAEFAGCAPSHAGRTVGKGILQAEGGIGGPMVTNLGGAIPIPNVPIGARYGVKDNIDVSGHINLLPIILGGFLALDASMTWGLYQHQGNRGFNLATGMGFIFFTNFQEGARISPLFDLAGSYTIDWFTPYVAVNLALDLWGGNVITNPQIGMEADIGKVTLQLSGTWYNPRYDWFSSSVRYVSPGYNGGIGVMIGLKYRFCGKGNKGE